MADPLRCKIEATIRGAEPARLPGPPTGFRHRFPGAVESPTRPPGPGGEPPALRGATAPGGGARLAAMAALLEVRELCVDYPRPDGTVRAVDRVSLHVHAGEVVALVGESGCGKSTLGLALLSLVPPPGKITGGQVLLAGEDLLALPERELRRKRGAGIAWVPQETGDALNPVLTVGAQVAEVLRAHRPLDREEARREAVRALARVGIPDPERRARQYPHEYSGGMKQRALLAMALAAGPRMLVADEPTTALDVTLQAGILDLLRRLAGQEDLGVLLVTHDLGVVAALCDRVLVMYAGRVVEEGPVDALFAAPLHPYTEGLLGGVPRPGIPRGRLPAIPGQVPDLAHLPPGCAFAPRCSRATDRCRDRVPVLEPAGEGRAVACLEAPPSREGVR